MRHEAIYNTHPTVVQIDGDTDAFDKDWNKVEIDEAKVAEEVKRLQSDYDAKKYQRDRAIAYPSIQDVVVALAEKEEGNDAMWQEITAQRAKVKSDNPKP